MKIYKVGGCVRDKLLGFPPKDIDYVVVGATEAEMLAFGFEKVGADFPVYLKDGCEYALARTERKSGKGYNGFITDSNPTVTLEEDLRRRDITINSMAEDIETGEIIDPYSGRDDLKKGIIRHTSEAFQDDPLRVLRVARFAARYDFFIAPETKVLMSKLVQANEIENLTAERVWLELEKGLLEKSPLIFVSTLMDVGAWQRIFPDINYTEEYLGLDTLPKLTFDGALMVIFAHTSTYVMTNILTKYKATADTVAQLIVFKKIYSASKFTLSVQDTLALLKSIDVYRRPEFLLNLYDSSTHFDTNYQQFVKYVINAFYQTREITFSSLTPHQQATLKGAEIGEAIDIERLKILM